MTQVMGLVSLWEEKETRALCHMRMQRERSPLQTRRRVLIRNGLVGIWGFPAYRIVIKKCLSFNPFRLWYCCSMLNWLKKDSPIEFPYWPLDFWTSSLLNYENKFWFFEAGTGSLASVHQCWMESQRQSFGWSDITNSMDMSVSKLQESVMDREGWHAAVHGVTKVQTQLSDWTDWQKRTALLLYQAKADTAGSWPWNCVSHPGEYGKKFYSNGRGQVADRICVRPALS